MKRNSMLSRPFFRRPGIRELVPDLKLVLAVLTVGCESHAGCYRPAGLGEDTGLDQKALAGALDDLERRGHIARDSGTGESFLSDFFRDNTFMTPARRGQARDDFMQIESPALRERVLWAISKNPECGLSESDLLKNQQPTAQGKGKGEGKGEGKEGGEAEEAGAQVRSACGAAASHALLPRTEKQQKFRTVRPSGIVTWLPVDVEAAERIERDHPQEVVARIVARLLLDEKRDPLSGIVEREIERQGHEKDVAARRRAAAEASAERSAARWEGRVA